MKTTNTILPTLNRLSLPTFSWEGVQWKVRSGEVGWKSSKPSIVDAPIRAARSVTIRLCVFSMRLSLTLLRTLGFLVFAVFAIADAMLTRIVAVPTAIAMAHARAAWLHRWSRAALWVLGVRLDRRGVMPPSEIITANYSSFLDPILLAAMGPCVFVAGAEVRRWPVIGLQLRSETLDLLLCIATPDGGLRNSPSETGMSKRFHISSIAEEGYSKRPPEPQTGTGRYQLCCAR